MHLDTTLKKMRDLKRITKDIFSKARIYHLTYGQVLDERDKHIFGYPNYAGLPRWAKAELRGYFDATNDHFWTYAVHWRVRLEGKLVVGNDVPAGRWVDVKPGAYVFNDRPDIIFSDSKEDNYVKS